MGLGIDLSRLGNLEGEHDVEEHVFELYTRRPPLESDNLGFITRKSESIVIHLEDSQIDLEVRQAFSGESTGFLCWKTAPYFADWVLTNKNCPFYGLFKQSPGLNVVELGAGVSAVCATVLGPKTANYVATDQIELRKLFKQNIENNITSSFSSKTLESSFMGNSNAKSSRRTVSSIDFLEFDWEYADQCSKNYLDFTHPSSYPDLIIACDVIYNEYLIPSFLTACKSLMSPSTGIIVGLQLRDENVLESFLKQTIEAQLELYTVPDSLLSVQLLRGFAVYYIQGKHSL